MYPLFICYPAAAVAYALRVLAACVAAASESRRDGRKGKQKRRKKRKRKAKAAYRPYPNDNCFYIIKVALLGGGLVVAHTYSAPYIQPLSGTAGLKSRAAKPFIYP